MNEEIKRILKMVEDRKINSDQAAELISAIKDKETDSGQQKSSKDKHLKVNIKSHNGKNINIKLPIKFVKGIIKATGKLPVHINGNQEIDMKAISEAIENDITGKIVELNSNEGDYIEVLIE
jgi:uncharacterized protein Veg